MLGAIRNSFALPYKGSMAARTFGVICDRKWEALLPRRGVLRCTAHGRIACCAFLVIVHLSSRNPWNQENSWRNDRRGGGSPFASTALSVAVGYGDVEFPTLHVN